MATTGAAALHLFSKHRVGVGVGHGLSPSTERMTVTRADGPRLLEIDDRPAFEAYRDFARRAGVELEPASSAPYMLRNELGVFFFDELSAARAPLAAHDDGSLLLAAPVEEGASICILDGEREPMLRAAREAAEAARAALEGAEASAVLVFDCVCRGMIIGDDFGSEIGAFEEVFPDVPVAGFLTYGEIARHGGRMQGWHNTTAVVVAIPRD